MRGRIPTPYAGANRFRFEGLRSRALSAGSGDPAPLSFLAIVAAPPARPVTTRVLSAAVIDAMVGVTSA